MDAPDDLWRGRSGCVAVVDLALPAPWRWRCADLKVDLLDGALQKQPSSRDFTCGKCGIEAAEVLGEVFAGFLIDCASASYGVLPLRPNGAPQKLGKLPLKKSVRRFHGFRPAASRASLDARDL
jgi:hypothetical protein